MRIEKRLLACGLVVLSAACSGVSSTSDQDLVSNQGQTDRYFSAVYSLASPALLASASVGADGTVTVDPAAAQAVAEEQAAFIANATALSPEVRVLYTYRNVLNAVSVLAPVALRDQLRKARSVLRVDDTSIIAPPASMPEEEAAPRAAFEENSVKWIGGSRVQAELGLRGKGIKVGVIDTGVDYTHKMFGGPGTVQAYTSNQPGVVESGSFPTARVVGGRDFVGTDFDTSSRTEAKRIPKPDEDPLDEQGHGTHVAGTIGGVGDGVNTYDGVAPAVDLYALKVFGKSGSTSEASVIAALEYAADPNGDGDLSDRLDVVNLSLGSSWGTRYGLYDEAVHALTRGGTLFVAAAGNSGASRYIVGSPSTADDALSVAASTDNSRTTTPADLLVGFSSFGPRSLDGAIKPETAAPGAAIISARMGGGDRGSSKSGTSMASPHVAGVAALLREVHPHASPAALRSLIINSGVPMKDRNGAPYAISKVGEGRVQAFEAVASPLVFDPPVLSLGLVAANAPQSGQRTVTVTNLADHAVHASVAFTGGGLTLSGADALDLEAGASTTLAIDYALDPSGLTAAETDLEARVLVHAGDLTLQIPALAVATRGSEIAVTPPASFGKGPVALALSNAGPASGDVLAFNLLAKDDVTTGTTGVCDLASAGYRVVKSDGKDLLQFAFDFAAPLSTWHFCELSVLVDADGDGVAEQEIGGTFDPDLRAPAALGSGAFASFLIDAAKMRAVQAQVEQGKAQPSAYQAAVIDAQPYVRYAQSTFAYISADLAKVRRTPSGKLRLKVLALPASVAAIGIDVLGTKEEWLEIDPRALPFAGMSERVIAAPSGSASLPLTSAGLGGSLVVYLPHNSAAAGRSVFF